MAKLGMAITLHLNLGCVVVGKGYARENHAKPDEILFGDHNKNSTLIRFSCSLTLLRVEDYHGI